MILESNSCKGITIQNTRFLPRPPVLIKYFSEIFSVFYYLLEFWVATAPLIISSDSVGSWGGPSVMLHNFYLIIYTYTRTLGAYGPLVLDPCWAWGPFGTPANCGSFIYFLSFCILSLFFKLFYFFYFKFIFYLKKYFF